MPDEMPAPVSAALKFIELMNQKLNPWGDRPPGSEDPKLAGNEKAAYDAAVEVLHLYFRGEKSFLPRKRSEPPPAGSFVPTPTPAPPPAPR